MTNDRATRTKTTTDLREQAADPTEERIIAEIEVTRAEMSGTIDEIGQRINPQVLADQARDQIREATVGRVEKAMDDAGQTAQQAGNTIIGALRENPVPTALAAIGIGWLAMRMRNEQAGHGHERGYGPRAYRSTSYAHDTPMGQRGRGYYDSEAGDHAEGRSIGDEIGQRGQEMGQQARQKTDELSREAKEAWEDVQWQARGQAENLQRQFDRTLDENPLVLGALAVGAGAAVALAIPETQQEREMLGEHRDRLLSEASGAASEALEKVEQGAREAGQEARNSS